LNEKDMWEYLINNKLLFNADYMNIKHFTTLPSTGESGFN